MDKRTILAFLLIGFILIITQTKFYRNLVMPKRYADTTAVVIDSTVVKSDSVPGLPTNDYEKTIVPQKELAITDESEKVSTFASLFQASDDVSYEDVIIETDNYITHINPKGAVISSWILKKYNYDDSDQVQLIQDEGYGNLGIFFINDEDTIYTYDSIFKPQKTKILFAEGQLTDSIRFVLELGDNRKLVKTYKFYNDQYIIDLGVKIENLADQFDNNQYYLSWHSGLAYTELDYSHFISKEDINSAKAQVFMGGSKEDLSLPNKPFQQNSKSNISGIIDWIAIRTKYFAMIILPEQDYNIEPILSGRTLPLYDDEKIQNLVKGADRQQIEKLKLKLRDRVKKNYSVTLKTTLPPSKLDFVSQQFRIYIGPLDYFIIKDYHPTLSKIMDFGMSVIRPFAKLVLKTFIFLHSFIPNYGIVLIIFSILIKILVYPLTKKSYVSMQKMQTLQPRMNELKEKYGKDPQRLNKETMKLYKESGVNPLSGCLPTLLQLPLLWAIFIVFRNTIELRDAAFIWWIKDLSAPDTIFQLPFTIPFYGDLVNILPIFMGATMFIQQKMTMKDPKQKAMVYFMPIFLTLIFNSFPSGLNLYYALFNLFSIIQQKWAPKKDTQDELADQAVKKAKGKNKIYKRK
jgi:YidC/Oxa1 family membrane protein insertase